MLNAIVALTALTQIIIGLLVYQKRRNSVTNITFGFISGTTLVWAITNYIYTLNPTSKFSLEIIRLVLFFVVWENMVFYVFAHNYPSERQTLSAKNLSTIFIFSLFVAGATLSPFVFSSVTIIRGQSTPNPGPLIPLFMVHATYTIGTSLFSLAKKTLHSKGQMHRQLQIILIASILMWGIVPITNFVVTLALHTAFFASVSPFYTLLFAGIIAYAIVAQKLFDIRLAVVRSVAYLLALGFIGIIYSGFILVLASLSIFDRQTLSEQRMEYVALALVTALIYPSAKRYFAKVTNKVLYQDAYDPQVFLDQLNQALVSNIELEKLLKTCAQTIVDHLKADYCLFGIKETDFEGIRLIGTVEKSFSKGDTAAARQVSTHLRTNVVITDYLPPEASKFRVLLAKNDIAALVRLVPEFASDKDVEGLGYLMLGQKRNGNMYTSQDIRMLGIIANELVIAIQNALRFEEIEKFNTTLQEEIARATGKLRRANTRLEELDNTKDDFISMASHQLRTPLTSVKGYLSMVIEGDAGKINPTQGKMLEQAFSSAQRMVFLITDLLNVSRLKTGKFVIEPVPVDLAKMVQEEVDQLAESANGKQLKLSYKKPAKFPEVMLDETKIRQVIMNFIDNAIYYTPAGGHIRVELVDKPQTVELRVVDDGIGVPRAEQHHLFTKFYRAANARQTRPDGTGLGLFMAQKVIVAQGGSIIFSSKEGQGSTFGFVFAKSRLKPANPAAVQPGKTTEMKAPSTPAAAVH